jgi:hypothetical protein
MIENIHPNQYVDLHIMYNDLYINYFVVSPIACVQILDQSQRTGPCVAARGEMRAIEEAVLTDGRRLSPTTESRRLPGGPGPRHGRRYPDHRDGRIARTDHMENHMENGELGLGDRSAPRRANPRAK